MFYFTYIFHLKILIQIRPIKFALQVNWVLGFAQTAATSIRAFYKLGTEPLPMDLEKLIVLH